MAEIHSALTPSEWAELLAVAETDGLDEMGRMMQLNRERRVMVDAALTARRYTAAAAIALHGERCALTWDDVDRLRAIAGGSPVDGGEAAWADDLADRIVALLPPREMRGGAPSRGGDHGRG